MRLSYAKYPYVYQLGVWSLIAAYACLPVIANWMIGNVGMGDSPPRVLPVFPGIYAPSGVYVIGLAFLLRDLVQSLAGKPTALVAIAVGGVVSYLVASPAIALASGVAFLVSEVADFLVYTPLRERGRTLAAVLLSNSVGVIVDSVLFLSLAFGSLAFLPGQLIGKAWASVLFLIVWFASKRGRDVKRSSAI